MSLNIRVELIDPLLAETYDITSRVSSIGIQNRMFREGTSFTVNAMFIELRHERNIINIYSGDDLITSGFVINQRDRQTRGIKTTVFACAGFGTLLKKRIIAKVYRAEDVDTQGNIGNIIKDIIASEVPELTTNSIQNINSTIGDRVEFPYLTIDEATAQLLGLNEDLRLYVDKDLDVHLFTGFESDAGDLNDEDILLNSLRVDQLSQETANSVLIVGAKVPSNDFIENAFVADGVNRYFILSNVANNLEITLDGVTQTFATEGGAQGDESFLFNRREKYIRIPENIATPFTGNVVARYKPTLQAFEKATNPTSIAIYGEIEKVIKDKNVTDRLSARRVARAELGRVGTFERVVTFKTYRRGITIGQKYNLSITNDEWNVVGSFVVEQVDHQITIDEDLLGSEYTTVTLRELT